VPLEIKLLKIIYFYVFGLPLSRQRRFQTRIVRFIKLNDKADYELRQELFNRLNP
jgi:hypothetical protein